MKTARKKAFARAAPCRKKMQGCETRTKNFRRPGGCFRKIPSEKALRRAKALRASGCSDAGYRTYFLKYGKRLLLPFCRHTASGFVLRWHEAKKSLLPQQKNIIPTEYAAAAVSSGKAACRSFARQHHGSRDAMMRDHAKITQHRPAPHLDSYLSGLYYGPTLRKDGP